MADSGEPFGTIIGADANFKGEFTFQSSAKLLGKIEGSITSKGKVHVADGSTCKAMITAKEIAVEGNVEGNIEASELIEIKPTGRIKGDVVAARMTMVDGASIDGHCRIGLNGKGPSLGKADAPEVKMTASKTPEAATAGKGR